MLEPPLRLVSTLIHSENMINRRALLTGAAALLTEAAIADAQTKAVSKSVFQHDLPDLTIKDWAVSAVEISYAPGQSSAAHRHPGLTLVYVLEGEMRSKVGDAPEKTYTPGEMFLETPNALHAVSRNASETKPAKFLAILLAEKGKPLTTPA